MGLLFASDMDGTFLSSLTGASEVNMAALHRCADEGVPFVFATGRPSRWVRMIAGIDCGHSVAITGNGAALYDLHTHETLIAHGIDPDVARVVIDELRGQVPGATFMLELGEECVVEPETFTGDFSDPCMHVGDLEPALAGPAPLLKLLVRSQQLNTEELYAACAPIVDDRLEATYSLLTDCGIVELSAPGVAKDAMLSQYCQELGIDQADVVAFGDMPNDLGMLQWAGRGYAMPTGHELLDVEGITRLDGDQPTAVGRTVNAILDARS